MKINLIKLIISASFVALLAGCGSSSDSAPAANAPAPPPPITK